MHAEIRKLAEVITLYSLHIKKGEKVLIDGDPTDTSLLHTYLHEEILKQGGIPFHKLTLGECDFLNYVHADKIQYETFAEDDMRILQNMDVLIGIEGSTNPRRLDRVLETIGFEKAMEVNRIMRSVRRLTFEKHKAGSLRVLYVEYPTSGMAQEFGLPLVEYEDRFSRACFLDKDDPCRAWADLRRKHAEVIDFLDGKRKIEIRGEELDLEFSINGEWISDDGQRYLPDGEVFTDAVVRDSVNGTVRITYPGIFQRRHIENIQLFFKNGEIVDFSSVNEPELLKQLLVRNDDQPKIQLAAFGIGTNYRIDEFIGNMSFDEKIGGTVHFALSEPMWVLLRRMGEGDVILVDGQPFYENGRVVV